jgi:general secretion pathway protein D
MAPRAKSKNKLSLPLYHRLLRLQLLDQLLQETSNRADDVAKEMERIFSSLEISVKSGRGVGITFTPVLRINSLMVVSSIPGIFEKVEKWLKELDRVPGEGSRLSTYVYYVQNGKAKDLADVLKQIYTPAAAARAGTTTATTTLPASQQRLVRPTTTPTTTPGITPGYTAPGAVSTMPTIPTPGAEAMGLTEGQINIVVDEVTNSLIIRAYQRDYRTIMETIKKLDIYPKQVLIEVLLAEVTLNESTKFGLEFSTFTDSFTKGSSTYSYTIGMGGTGTPSNFTSGLRYAITSAGKLAAAIQASASQDRLRVISSPHVMASNNKEARIQVGSSQPILTNTYTTTATGTPGVVEGTIEYKDVGIILTVTPRISDAKLVTLEMSIESSTVGTTQLGNLSSVPFFGKKTAKTTLSIIEGQTIVIGGLIQESKDTIKSGVPFLSRIPILGALFGFHDYEKTKTETVIFLTPHVIGELDDSNRITEEFRDKLWGIQKELEVQQKETEKDRKKGLPLY